MNYYDSRLVLIETAMREREIEAAQMQGLLKALMDEIKEINKQLESKPVVPHKLQMPVIGTKCNDIGLDYEEYSVLPANMHEGKACLAEPEEAQAYHDLCFNSDN